MRILFICSEYEGLIKTGGLADACRGLASSLLAAGHQVSVILPRYGALYNVATEAETSVFVELGGQQYGCAVRSTKLHGVALHLVEHHDFFARERPYDDGQHGYADNPLRFAFFCKVAIAWAARQQAFDVLHGHDWQSAPAAFYLHQHQQHNQRLHSPHSLVGVPFVFTIHNGAYQQQCDAGWAPQLGLPIHQQAAQDGYYHELNFLQIALQYATKINTVSQGYRDELLSEPAANGLAGWYQQRQLDFSGILNGCDYQLWDPATDQSISANYNAGDLTGKATCKRQLQQQCQLTQSNGPLLVAVSRVTGQKGYDILIPALKHVLSHYPVQVVIVGSGEASYCQQLHQLTVVFPDKFRFIEGFNEQLAHQVEAAGDFFLMPSLFEPCGLNQLYSLRYGTLPLVRLTGGLKDTVVPWPNNMATGIGFAEPNTEALLEALRQALTLYQDQPAYKKIQQRAMSQSFSWSDASEQYLALYQQAVDAAAATL
ncbi:MAG: glycogen synthase [Rheinheimera sp.]|uniref:glycogen synthase n=1 Tax=Arsukibacterium sp. UBA3155 TaxID=1946058 RepID=UPI000C9273A2|nr:glycogen synthase [Arsukibacterium sp. UBA3155]MAD76962.1 glycogen synthase [Rheinheimera sp.]